VRDAIAGLEPASADPTMPPAGKASVSVGVSRFPEDGTDAEMLLAAAQAAVERARAQGPGSVVAPAAAS
jgi:GGDEF domain-containing protein